MVRESAKNNLLVVDDEPLLRDSMAYDFRRKGFNVFCAGGGNEALEVLRAHPIDVVITDVRMPGGGGLELLSRIKDSNPKRPSVTLVSGFGDFSLEDAFDWGAEAVFPKPFDRKALTESVMRAITSKDELLSREPGPAASVDRIELPDGARIASLGRGGIFIELGDDLPLRDSTVSFRVPVGNGEPRIIEGVGVVRWVRSVPSDGLPSGCGIEFCYLSDACRGLVIDAIESGAPKAYIPKR